MNLHKLFLIFSLFGLLSSGLINANDEAKAPENSIFYEIGPVSTIKDTVKLELAGKTVKMPVYKNLVSITFTDPSNSEKKAVLPVNIILKGQLGENISSLVITEFLKTGMRSLFSGKNKEFFSVFINGVRDPHYIHNGLYEAINIELSMADLVRSAEFAENIAALSKSQEVINDEINTRAKTSLHLRKLKPLDFEQLNWFVKNEDGNKKMDYLLQDVKSPLIRRVAMARFAVTAFFSTYFLIAGNSLASGTKVLDNMSNFGPAIFGLTSGLSTVLVISFISYIYNQFLLNTYSSKKAKKKYGDGTSISRLNLAYRAQHQLGYYGRFAVLQGVFLSLIETLNITTSSILTSKGFNANPIRLFEGNGWEMLASENGWKMIKYVAIGMLAQASFDIGLNLKNRLNNDKIDRERISPENKLIKKELNHFKMGFNMSIVSALGTGLTGLSSVVTKVGGPENLTWYLVGTTFITGIIYSNIIKKQNITYQKSVNPEFKTPESIIRKITGIITKSTAKTLSIPGEIISSFSHGIADSLSSYGVTPSPSTKKDSDRFSRQKKAKLTAIIAVDSFSKGGICNSLLSK